jgi:hypothetical protein
MDCEFIEGKQDKTFLGIKYGETKPTVDLISIGIVGELQSETKIPLEKQFEYMKEYGMKFTNKPQVTKEYYAISKDFNLKAAWKNEWVRENVLKPIWKELKSKHTKEYHHNLCETDSDYIGTSNKVIEYLSKDFCINSLERLLNKYGKSNKQIAKEITEFVNPLRIENIIKFKEEVSETTFIQERIDLAEGHNIEFYGYYSDYDWVVFCQLFGTMMDLPKGFPMYCLDLQQYKHDIEEDYVKKGIKEGSINPPKFEIEKLPNYPKQTNEHNALADAKWNYELYKFLNTL